MKARARAVLSKQAIKKSANLEPHRPQGLPKPMKNHAQRANSPTSASPGNFGKSKIKTAGHNLRSGNMPGGMAGGMRGSMPGLVTPGASRVIRA